MAAEQPAPPLPARRAAFLEPWGAGGDVRNPFDRRPPGRPKEDPDAKYGEHFQGMAATICATRCSVAKAADKIARSVKGVSADRLARLYRRNRREYEVARMEHRTQAISDRALWWASLQRAEKIVAGDERLQVIARDIVKEFPRRVPLHLWYPAELHELLARARLLDRDLYPKPGSNFPIAVR